MTNTSSSQLTRNFADPNSASNERWQSDQYGFLRETSSNAYGVESLFDFQATLIVAPPWLGKTTVAKALNAHLLQRGSFNRPLEFEERSHLTQSESYRSGGQFEPPWWSTWTSGQENACWILDSLDEVTYHEPGLFQWLLSLFRDLAREQRERLWLILFGRGAELPKGTVGAFREIYGEQFRYLELLPLDRENAEAIVTPQHLNRTLETIDRCKLQHIAGYPAVLEYLKTRQERADLTDVDVWQGLLKNLLEEPDRLRPQRSKCEPEERFRAAGHLAAALTFSGVEEIQRGEHGNTSNIPALEDLIPLGQSVDRDAAREVLKSGMFSVTPTGHRFVQRNVREWMCAFGIRDLGLSRLKSLMQLELNEDVPVPRQFYDLAALLYKTTTKDDVRAWLEEFPELILSDAAPPNFALAATVLDRLEKLATEGEWTGGFGAEERFSRLGVPGLGENLSTRLADESRPTPARLILLRIASAIGAREPAEIAARISRNTDADPELRSWSASYLRKVGDENALRSTIPFVERAQPTSRVEKETISILISAFLRYEIWDGRKAYEHLPEIDSRESIVDATSILPGEISELMTFDDAVAIFKDTSAEEIEELNRHHGGFPRQSSRRQVLAAAAKIVATRRPVDPQALNLVIPFCVTCTDWDLNADLEDPLQLSSEARRFLFEAYVERERRDSSVQTYWMRHTLVAEDLFWLEEHLPAMASGAAFVWPVFLSLAHREETPVEVRDRCQEFVRKHAPESLEHFRRARDQQEEWEREEEERAEARKRKERPIEEKDEDVLGKSSLTPQVRLWALAEANFLEPEFRPRNLIGEWSDLPEDLRERVLSICQEDLDQVEPTPVPPGRSYPGAILFEASTFLKLFREQPDFALTSERITRWLPAALAILDSPAKNELLLSCVRVGQGQEATETVVLQAIEREMAQDGHYSVLLQDLPQELWTPRICNWVAEKVGSEETPAETRVTLLGFLGARAAEDALALARQMVAEQSIEALLGVQDDLLIVTPKENLGSRALDVLLAFDPDAAWPLIQQGFEILGKNILTLLPSLYEDSSDRLTADLRRWPTERHVELEEMLFRAYPPDEDPDLSGKSYSITPDHQLRRLRFQLFEILLDRSASSGREHLEHLSDMFPRFGEWYRWRTADREAKELLADPFAAPPVEAGYPPVEKVVRALISADYRLARSSQELLEVLVEELERFNEDVGEDLPMLYLPEEIKSGSKRRHEEALQAYVHRRLADRLPGKIVDRECQVKYRRRQDIRVMVPAPKSPDPSVVILEVKWSDNSDTERGVSTGLKNQLGQKYLVEERRDHGIYLVGWNGTLGTWRDREVKRPCKAGLPGSLQQALEAQALQFQEQHPEITIRPVVLDLSWISNQP